jgi:hypothetical protein
MFTDSGKTRLAFWLTSVLLVFVTATCGGDDPPANPNGNSSGSATAPTFATGNDGDLVAAMILKSDKLGEGFETTSLDSYDEDLSYGGKLREDSGQLSGDFSYYAVGYGGALDFTAGHHVHITAPTDLDAEDIKIGVASFETEAGARDAFVGLQYWGSNQQNQWFSNCTEERPADVQIDEYRLCSAARKAFGTLRQDRFVAFITFTGVPGVGFDSVVRETMRLQAETMQVSE